MTKKTYYPQVNQNLDLANIEEEILKFWEINKTFEKSIQIRDHNLDDIDDNTSPVVNSCSLSDHTNCRHENLSPRNEFVFYDGPPFANGLPHYGHLLTGFIKDVFARYQTMQGKKVERKFGWDTHGLPVEMETEKELTKSEGRNISGQIAIQEYGIEKFNDACRTSVMKYANQWKEYVTRQGRWVDFDNGYKTMDINYMESVIWAFSELYKKGFIYEKLRVVPYSWACQTPLSNFETRMDNSYREKASKSVTIKFELKDKFLDDCNKLYLAVWTTTPWTLPSNLALAVGKKITYVAIRQANNDVLILAKDLIKNYAKDLGVKNENDKLDIIKEFEGTELIGKKYEPLFPYFSKKIHTPKTFSILHADFVSTEDGTGIVHMAPGFGEDDQIICEENNIKIICPVDEGGKFTSEIYDIAENDLTLSLQGKHVFDCNDDIIKYLKLKNNWLKTEQYIHNYPHCWRTDTPLIYKAVSSWYVKVSSFKDRMVELNLGKKKFDKDQIPQILETERLIGKLVSMEDFDNLHTKLFTNKEVRKYYYFRNDQICTEEQTKKQMQYFSNQYEKGLPRFALYKKDTGEFLALAGFAFYDPKSENFENGKVEISYMIATDFWRQGYATEIAKSLISYGFKNLPVDSIYAATVGDNFASANLLEKLGFYVCHVGENDYPKSDKPHKLVLYKFDKKISKDEDGINWIPNHIKEGQFGKWLEGARDWSITRNRFWGCPVPVWRSNDPKCPRIDVYGSIQELENDFNITVKDLHRPYIDQLTRLNPDDPRSNKNHPDHVNCSKMVRVTDVLDCWFESGSMPFAQVHYPFENREWFENNFPADFITEYIAQTRGWFYTMTVLSTALFDKIPFRNVICHGTILDENSQKLSKRLKNYPDPVEIFNNYGSDVMRFYLMSQPVMKGQELKIDKEGKAIKDTYRISIKPFLNAFNFFCLYANSDSIKASRIIYNQDLQNSLDIYILSKLKLCTLKVKEGFEKYDTITVTEEFNNIFDVLNNWYIRRSRSRFWSNEKDQDYNSKDKQDAYNVLYTVLVTCAEIFAPILPFTCEYIWQSLQTD